MNGTPQELTRLLESALHADHPLLAAWRRASNGTTDVTPCLRLETLDECLAQEAAIIVTLDFALRDHFEDKDLIHTLTSGYRDRWVALTQIIERLAPGRSHFSTEFRTTAYARACQRGDTPAQLADMLARAGRARIAPRPPEPGTESIRSNVRDWMAADWEEVTLLHNHAVRGAALQQHRIVQGWLSVGTQ